jgi:hypothetical protein
MEDSDQLLALLGQVKRLAKRYYGLTGRPLGCTGEIAEYEAVRILGLKLAPVRQSGFDAIRHAQGREQRIQIKGRCVHGPKPVGRMGRIDCTNEKWESVMLVLLDENLDAFAIYEADRKAVIDTLQKPGSKARNERGALAVSTFMSLGEVIWRR